MKRSDDHDHRGRFALIGPGLAVYAFVAASCTPDAPEAPEEPPFAVRFTSERLEIGMNVDIELCRGQLDLWEAQIDAIELHLGFTRESAWIYLFLGDYAGLSRTCNRPDVGGCWSDPVIYSDLNSVAHELVHAWSMSTNPDPLPVLREGIAQRMAGPAIRSSGLYTAADLLLELNSSYDYLRASHFVAWLMETYGTDRFVDLYRRTSRGASAKSLDKAARAIFNRSIDELLAAYQDASPTHYPGMGSQACGAASKVAWRGDAATWASITDCADGPLTGAAGGPWQRVVLDVPDDGAYVLDTGRRIASMTYCLTTPTDAAALEATSPPVLEDWFYDDAAERRVDAYGWDDDENWADHSLDLRAGTYELWIRDPGYGVIPGSLMSLTRQ